LLEQFAVVGEQASDAFALDEFLDDADGKVGFAHPDRANDEQALRLKWVLFGEITGV